MATRRSIPLRAVFVALLVVPLTGCPNDDGASGDAICDRLAGLPPGSRWVDTDLIVFVDPDATLDDEGAIRSMLDSTEEVASHTWVSQEEAYDEFVELNRDRPELHAAIGPEVMPASARVALQEAATEVIDEIGARLEGTPGVYRVIYRGDMDQSVIELSVRPLTSEFIQGLSAFTHGRSTIQLAEVAPDELREAAQVLDTFWADPGQVDGAPSEEVTAAARRITAYYDTECQ